MHAMALGKLVCFAAPALVLRLVYVPVRWTNAYAASRFLVSASGLHVVGADSRAAALPGVGKRGSSGAQG
eukprot:scaffold6211_cov118-Isochrysis_galbana.AAC.5